MRGLVVGPRDELSKDLCNLIIKASTASAGVVSVIGRVGGIRGCDFGRGCGDCKEMKVRWRFLEGGDGAKAWAKGWGGGGEEGSKEPESVDTFVLAFGREKREGGDVSSFF